MDEKTLGKKLQLARQRAGLTQQQLCQKTGLSISTLAKIERGAIKAPSVFTVNAIAQTVNVPLERIVGTVSPSGEHTTKKRSKTGISFVYFDVNGVLVHFFHRAFAMIAKDTGASAYQAETTFWHYNDAICRGEMSMAEFNSTLAKQLDVTSVDWADYYFSCVDPINEMLEVLLWASKHYRVGLLTNMMPGFLDRLITEHKIPDIDYDAIADSSAVGAVKPEAKIFEVAQAKAAVKPSEILLVEDSNINVMAAEKEGWQALWFDDYRPEESGRQVHLALEF